MPAGRECGSSSNIVTNAHFNNSFTMKTYLSMLRGINVSGQKKIPMAELKSIYEDLEFKNVTTYIQSGNVIFQTENELELSKRIERKIEENFKFHVPVIIRTNTEMEMILTENPFLKEKNINVERLHVTFLNESPAVGNLEKLKAISCENDTFVILGKDIYLYCPNGYGRTKLNNNFFENKLKVTATTRNWRTVCELAKISKSIS
jgi:uncharacterized protein (DUF1697 family)